MVKKYYHFNNSVIENKDPDVFDKLLNNLIQSGGHLTVDDSFDKKVESNIENGLMSFREIGQSLDITAQGALVIYNKAIAKLRTRIGKDLKTFC